MSPILECKSLTKRINGVNAVNGLDISVEPGRIVGLFGPEKSGKTTLMKLAAGLLTVDSGEVLIDGKAPGVETKRITAFLPNAESSDECTYVRDSLRLFRDFYDDFDEGKAIAMLNELGIETKEKISDLPKSSLVKLRLSLIFSRRAKLYLLDDPVKNVDTATLSFALNTIVSARPEESTVVISSRNPSDVERIIQDAAFISAGRITLFEDAAKLRAEKGKSIHAVYTEEFKC